QEAFVDRDGTLFPKDTFFDKLAKAGGADHFAVTNFHAYKPDSHDTSVADVARQVRRKMATYGFGDQPLWITETNAGDNPAKFEASRTFCARNIVEALAGGVDRVFWWNTIDYPGESPTLQLGLFSSTGQPRPAFFSFLTTTRMLAGLTHVDEVKIDGVSAYRSSGGGRTVTVIWDDAGRTVDVGTGVSAFDDFGNPLIATGRIKLDRHALFLVSA
ncbi:MAG TPA: hypothetical protein VKA30_07835, partial [Actinomycetota bacterium]|nr:hypothetical protein [Actinomycetota bacterium]